MKSSSRQWFTILLPFLLIPFIYNFWGGVNPFEFPKHAWLAFWIGTFLIFFVFLKIFGQRKQTFFYHPWVSTFIGALGISFLFSTLFSIAPMESFWGSYERLQGALTAALYGIYFVICLHVLGDKKDRLFVLKFMVALATLLALHAIYQKMMPDSPFELMFAGRSYSLIGTPNILGQLLIFPLCTAIFLARNFFKKKARANSALFASAAVIIFLGLYFTGNRASLLGLVGGMFIFIFFSIQAKFLKITLAVAGVAGLIFVFMHLPNLRSLGSRTVLWKDTLAAIPQHVLLGTGPETYYQSIQKTLSPDLYLYERLTDIPDRSHNVLLDAAATRGLPGLVLGLVQLIFIAWLLVKRKIKTLVGQITVVALIAYEISLQFGFALTADFLFYLTMWGILLRETLTFKKTTVSLRPMLRFGIGILLTACGIFLITHAVRVLKIDRYFGNAINSFLVDEKTSHDWFQKTLELNPPYAYVYQSFFMLGQHVDGEEYMQWFSKITGENFQVSLEKAKRAFAQKDFSAANAYFAEVEAKAPNWPVLWMEKGEAFFRTGAYHKAASALERLIAIAPPYWKWKADLESRSSTEKETYRIFHISNQRFYEALAMLADSYRRSGKFADAIQIYKFL